MIVKISCKNSNVRKGYHSIAQNQTISIKYQFRVILPETRMNHCFR